MDIIYLSLIINAIQLLEIKLITAWLLSISQAICVRYVKIITSLTQLINAIATQHFHVM